jgi:hypothetical protein
MLKQAMVARDAQQLTDAAMMASRQFWLAGLGAATMARRWASKDALPFFHSLVKEGHATESTVMRVLNTEIGTSAARAARLWSSTRQAVSTTVNTLAAGAASVLPQARPVKARGPARKARVAKHARTVKAAGKRVVRSGKRAAKKA